MEGNKFIFVIFGLVVFLSCSDEIKPIEGHPTAEYSSSSVLQSSNSNSSSSSSDPVVPEPEIVGTLFFSNPGYTDENGKNYYWLDSMPDVRNYLAIVNETSAKCKGDIRYEPPQKDWDIKNPGVLRICANAICDEKLKELKCIEAEFVPDPIFSGTCTWQSSIVIGDITVVPQFEIQNNYGRCNEYLYMKDVFWDGKIPKWKADSAHLAEIKIKAECNGKEIDEVACPNIKIKNPKATDYIVDNRDKQIYQTVEINALIWMAENLNYNSNNSVCYEDKPDNCVKYGRLYSWAAATTAICPSGWRLPSDEELHNLMYGSNKVNSLKAVSGWNNNGGTDSYGFSALPSGSSNLEYGTWWAINTSNNAYFCEIRSTNSYVECYTYVDPSSFRSVRCVKE